MIYGYCRVSTQKQSVGRQIANITKAYPDAEIVQEIYTGTTLNRPVLNRLLKKLKKGDIVVFDEVSRMSRERDKGYELYMELFDKGIELVFLKEPHINTQKYRDAIKQQLSISTTTQKDGEYKGKASANLFENLESALNQFMRELVEDNISLALDRAEKEREYLSQRTKEGLQKAKEEGKVLGTKPKAKLNVKKAAAAKAVMIQMLEEFGGTLSDKECLQYLCGNPDTRISRNSYYKYKKEIRSHYYDQ